MTARASLLLALLFASLGPFPAVACGVYALNGQAVVSRSSEDGDDHVVVHPARSPDGLWAISVGPGAHDFWLTGGGRRYPLRGVWNAGLVEVSWSPDARYVAVNQSEGGAVGEWEPVFYQMRPGHAPRQIDLAAEVKAGTRGFARYRGKPAQPNWAHVAWLRHGHEALIVAQVPQSSGYANMGELEFFRVSVPGARILERADSAAFLRKWSRFACPDLVEDARESVGLPRTLR